MIATHFGQVAPGRRVIPLAGIAAKLFEKADLREPSRHHGSNDFFVIRYLRRQS
jgi:hypothetical protein